MFGQRGGVEIKKGVVDKTSMQLNLFGTKS